MITKILDEFLTDFEKLTSDLLDIELIKHLAARFPTETSEWRIWFDPINEATLTADEKQQRQSDFAEISSFLRQQKFSILFVQLRRAIDSTLEFESKGLSVSELPRLLEGLVHGFEETVRTMTRENIFHLMWTAFQISQFITAVRPAASSIHFLLVPSLDPIDGRGKLSLFFSSQINYRELIIKLTAVEDLYNELCRLHDISTSEYPLQIAKLEVGSFWLKIFGENRVITLITSLVDKSVDYLHRNFTNEGKIHALPKKVEAVEGLLGLSQLLAANGIDNTIVKENIGHSSAILSKQLTALLGGEPLVKVNEVEHYIGAVLDEKLLRERETLLLNSGEDESTDKT